MIDKNFRAQSVNVVVYQSFRHSSSRLRRFDVPKKNAPASFRLLEVVEEPQLERQLKEQQVYW